jgi:hypothetical protein
MEYNTQLPKLILPEYGRNIQKLVEYACTIKNREERNKVANEIISIMARVNPRFRDIADFRHKLWDHLFIISNFKLDVDSPYPVPSKEILTAKPERVKYPSSDGKIKFKHYGKFIERLIEKASAMKNGKEKDIFVEAIANLMKKYYLVWNRNTVYDSVILEELEYLSEGKLKVPENFRMTSAHNILSRTRNINRDQNDRAGERARETHSRDNRVRDRDRGRDRNNGGGRYNDRRRGR